ncbi:MAG: hypothetical protein J0H49_23230 [Acidobacteria bacterium]|nr:hypothetical protein [Acidobacteriota bacterium]
MKPPKKQSFFAGIGSLLLFFVLITGTLVGLFIAFTPTPRSPILGWFVLLVSLSLTALTAPLWGRSLPGVFCTGAFGSIVMLISGHLPGQSGKVVNRPFASILLVSFAALSLLATRLDRSRKWNRSERAAYTAVSFLMAVAFAWEDLGTAALAGQIAVLGWLAYRDHRARVQTEVHRRPRNLSGVAGATGSGDTQQVPDPDRG